MHRTAPSPRQSRLPRCPPTPQSRVRRHAASQPHAATCASPNRIKAPIIQRNARISRQGGGYFHEQACRRSACDKGDASNRPQRRGGCKPHLLAAGELAQGASRPTFLSPQAEPRRQAPPARLPLGRRAAAAQAEQLFERVAWSCPRVTNDSACSQAGLTVICAPTGTSRGFSRRPSRPRRALPGFPRKVSGRSRCGAARPTGKGASPPP